METRVTTPSHRRRCHKPARAAIGHTSPCTKLRLCITHTHTHTEDPFTGIQSHVCLEIARRMPPCSARLVQRHRLLHQSLNTPVACVLITIPSKAADLHVPQSHTR